MKQIKALSAVGMMLPARLEVRYDRTFLIDLKSLETATMQKMYRFVFEGFFRTNQLQDLPEFQVLENSEIWYRFTIDNFLISIEVTGQIVKFLRILPKPNIWSKAIQAGATVFLTNDQQLADVSGLSVLILDRLLME